MHCEKHHAAALSGPGVEYITVLAFTYLAQHPLTTHTYTHTHTITDTQVWENYQSILLALI